MVKIESHSGVYTLQTQQKLKTSLAQAWDFFSTPSNLSKITPKHLGFFITSELDQSMYPGQIITYRINIFPGVAYNWVTEITHVDDKKYFVDEQRIGPYKMWHHEHHFQETNDGVLMTDKVSYKLPFGIIGRLTHPVIVKTQLLKIFYHRKKILDKMFNKSPNPEMAIVP